MDAMMAVCDDRDNFGGCVFGVWVFSVVVAYR